MFNEVTQAALVSIKYHEVSTDSHGPRLDLVPEHHRLDLVIAPPRSLSSLLVVRQLIL